MRILQISNPKELAKVMREIKVDAYGIRIMVPKGITHTVRINSLPCISANILKQEMLSLGAEAAVTKATLTGKVKKTDCILMGNLAQFNRLAEKLNKQPFGLSGLGRNLSRILSNYQSDEFILKLGGHKLALSPGQTKIMGIVNLTPDSFSGDGLYPASAIQHPLSSIIDFTQKLIEDGADIIDIGGESSRPGAKPVSVKEESKRIMPSIKILAKKIKVPISVDTYKPQVAERALDSGAVIVNDISGLKNPKMCKIISKYDAAAVIMHIKGQPKTMQKNPRYACLLNEIIDYLDNAVNDAVSCGINKDKIIIDPGIGFGKALEHNLQILKNLKEFKILGKPILAGPSRKSFIGKILKCGPEGRLAGTISACVLAAGNGANIVRVHDVRAVKDALKVSDAILSVS